MQLNRSVGTPQGYRESEINRYSDTGISVHENDFSWDSGAEMRGDYRQIELHYRISPRLVHARVYIGAQMDFPLGRIMLIPPLPLRARAMNMPENVRTICCRFDGEWLEDFVGVKLEWRADRLAAYADINDMYLDCTMRRLANEITEEQPGTGQMIGALTQELAIHIVRRFNTKYKSWDNKDAMLASDRLRRIREMVYASDDRIPTAGEIADQCKLSLGYLRRAFREMTGQTLHEFLEEARITTARQLLRETNLPLKIISHRVGYSHHSAFTFAFRHRMGVPPKDYRRDAR